MNEEEDVLRRARLRPPSEALDGRIEQLLKAPPARRPSVFTRNVLLWQCAAACTVCTVSAFFAGTFARGPESKPRAVAEVHYVIQAQPQAFDVFDWTKYPKKSAPCSALKKYQARFETPSTT